jgi:hypothetical protein
MSLESSASHCLSLFAEGLKRSIVAELGSK